VELEEKKKEIGRTLFWTTGGEEVSNHEVCERRAMPGTLNGWKERDRNIAEGLARKELWRKAAP